MPGDYDTTDQAVQTFVDLAGKLGADTSSAELTSAEADLAKISVWAHLPAVQSGQVYLWYAAAPYSYQSYAKIYQELAAELRNAKKL